MLPEQGFSPAHGAGGVQEHDHPGREWRPALREAGLRVTKQRLAVLEALERTPHGTAEEILAEVRAHLPGITVQSIYTVIHSLVDVGILRKLDLPGSPSRYEPELHDNHHHVVCRSCGRIEDVACAGDSVPCMHPPSPHGMRVIDVADVIYHGICENCAAADEVTPVHATA